MSLIKLQWILVFLVFSIGFVFGSFDEGSGVSYDIEGSGAPPKHNVSTIAEQPSGEGSGGPMIPPRNPEDDFSGELPIPAVDINEGSGDEGPQTAKPLPPVVDMVTGIAEESTMPPKDPAEYATHDMDSELEEEPTGPTTPFDIDNLETGVPEGSTKEPYMPKPVTKPKPGSGNYSEGGFSDGYSDGETGWTEIPGGSSELPMESIPPVHWTKSTPKDFTISQKIDENSAGYQQLLHMLEDLGHRRKQETFVQSTMTDFYVSRAASLMDTIEHTFTNVAISNITMAQEYIKGILADSSVSVRNAYSEIVTLTSQPSFYYIPKRQRYLMVNKIVTDMSSSGKMEMMSLNKQAKTYCRDANVDTPPYSLGNLFGNMLANGAVLTK